MNLWLYNFFKWIHTKHLKITSKICLQMPLQVASMCFIDKFSGASPRTHWGLRTPQTPSSLLQTPRCLYNIWRVKCRKQMFFRGGVDGLPHSAHGGGKSNSGWFSLWSKKISPGGAGHPVQTMGNLCKGILPLKILGEIMEFPKKIRLRRAFNVI